MGKINRYIWFVIMIVIGAGAGLYYAWYVKPADFVDAVFYHLRQDYKTDYVLMTAEIYDQDHDRYRAMIRLDKIRDVLSGEYVEEAVQTAIRTAEGFGYNPVDLDKMRRLFEMVTGQRSTPTPQYDPTMEFSIQQTSTAVALNLNPTDNPTIPPDESGSASNVPQADNDPFGTGIIITTDPSAVPTLNLPSAPTITPIGGYIQEEETGSASAGVDSFFDDSGGFGALPDSFFEDRGQ